MASKQIYKLLHPIDNNIINEIDGEIVEHSNSYTLLCIILVILLSYLYKTILDFIAKRIHIRKKIIKNKRDKK